MQSTTGQVTTNTALCRILSLNCSKCSKEISHTSSNSIWYYYLKPPQNNQQSEMRETRFICETCKNELQSKDSSYIPMLQELHRDLIPDDDFANVIISFQQDFSTIRQAPQEAKLIRNQMFCEKCLQHQITIQNFDIKLKTYVELHKAKAIQVAVALAKEQNEKDQKNLSYLRDRLSITNSTIEKALILNKITNILKKYSQQQ